MSAQPPSWPTPPPPPPPPQGPPPRAPARSSGSPLKWILISIGAVFALALGGCMACVAVVAIVGEEEREAQQRNAIPDAAARALPLGTPKATVTRRHGDGTDAQGDDRDEAGEDCLFYNLKGDEIGRQWGLCFDRRGRLTAKYRWA